MSDRLTFVESKQFKDRVTAGDFENVAVRKHFIADEIKQEGDSEDSRIFRFVISTGAVDRDRDTIDPKGWDLKNYRKNPVVLFAHDGRKPPIGRGKDISKDDTSLSASVEFMDNEVDTSGFSDMIYRMVRGGFLKATSVGFMPKVFEFVDDEEPGNEDRRFGIDFKKQELLEFSIVPVPSNPEALIEARSKGIDTQPLATWYEEALDQWADYRGMLLVPRKEIETLFNIVKGKRKTGVYNLSNKQKDDLARKNSVLLKAQRSDDRPFFIAFSDGKFHFYSSKDPDKPLYEGLEEDHALAVWAKFNEIDPESNLFLPEIMTFKDESIDSITEAVEEQLATPDDDSEENGLTDDQNEQETDENEERDVENQEEDEEISESENEETATDDTESVDIAADSDESGQETIEEPENQDPPVTEPDEERSSEPIHLKIVGDGTPYGTTIVDSKTGRLVGNVRGFSLSMSAEKLLEGRIDLICPDIDIDLPGLSDPKALSGETTITISKYDPESSTQEQKDVVSDNNDGVELEDEVLLTFDDEPESEEDEPQTDEQTGVNASVSAEEIRDLVNELLPDLTRQVIREQLRKIKGQVD